MQIAEVLYVQLVGNTCRPRPAGVEDEYSGRYGYEEADPRGIIGLKSISGKNILV
jgi:hypothetical protein